MNRQTGKKPWEKGSIADVQCPTEEKNCNYLEEKKVLIWEAPNIFFFPPLE